VVVAKVCDPVPSKNAPTAKATQQFAFTGGALRSLRRRSPLAERQPVCVKRQHPNRRPHVKVAPHTCGLRPR
jgi:hypothetical protein